MNYAIDDGNGDILTGGLDERTVWAVARQYANERGESVYVYEDRPLTADELEDDVATPVTPVAPDCAGAL